MAGYVIPGSRALASFAPTAATVAAVARRIVNRAAFSTLESVMAERERRVRWPDGASLSLREYRELQRIAANTVFVGKGMTSEDTLGPGLSGNVSTIFPSVTLNGTIPGDGGLIPKPWRSRVTSIEAGIGTPNAASVTSTFTPQQAADFLAKYVFGVRPAMGPDDELSPFARPLSSSNGSLGAPSKPAVKYVGAQGQNSL
ncbi:hypothetical protein KXW38_008996, partial [Aspergillus fumigatus]